MMRAAVVMLSIVSGCGGDDGAADRDGGGAADATAGYVPAPPTLRPCPSGWVERSDRGVTTCEPWAAPPPETCADDEAVFPGEEGCIRVGTACPAGDFPEGLPTESRVVYVLAGAPDGGNGSIERPYATIGAAFGSTFANTIVAIGKGTYDEIVRPGDRVTLWGACAAETILTSGVPDARGAVVETRTSGSVLRNVRIVGAGRNGVLCRSGCSMSLEDVVVEGSTAVGVSAVFDANLTLTGVVIRDTRTDAGGEFGRGLNVELRSVATASRLSVERNHEIGIAAFGEGAVVRAADVLVRGTLPQDLDREFGRGISAELGGRVEVERAALLENHDTGLFVNEPGSSALAADVVIRDVRSVLGQFGRGVNAQNGTTVELRRVLVERSIDVGLFVAADSTLDGEDVVVADTAARPMDMGGGAGAVSELRGRLVLRRAAVIGSLGIGIAASEAEAEISDVSVIGVGRLACLASTCPASAYALGLASIASSRFDARSFRIVDAEICGVLIAEGGSMTLASGEVRRSRIGACVQVPGYDVGTLTRDVAYLENGTSLDTTELPVPGAFGAR